MKVFYKFKYKNTWLYSTRLALLIINCEREINPVPIEVRGIGLLSLREDCKAIISNLVLIPSKKLTYFNYIYEFPNADLSLNIDRIGKKYITKPRSILKS